MRIFIYLYFLLIIFGCSEKNQKSKDFPGLEIVDSIQVFNDPDLFFQDLDPVLEKLLFIKKSDSIQEVQILDFNGNLQYSFSLDQNYKKNNIHLLSALFFKDHEGIVVFGSEEIITYSMTGEIDSIISFSDVQRQYFSRSDFSFSLENFGDKIFLLNNEIVNLKHSDLSEFSNVEIFYVFDLKSKESTTFLKFPKSSIFQKNKYFFKGAWSPVYTFDKNLLHVVFGIEPTIYSYSPIPPYQLLSSLPLKLNSYRSFNGLDKLSSKFRFFDHSFTSGKILSIKKLLDYFVIVYFPGINDQNLGEQLQGKSTEDIIKNIRKLKKKYPNRVAVIDPQGNTLADFIPEKLNPTSMIIRNGDLYMLGSSNIDSNDNLLKIFRLTLNMKDK